MSCLMDFVNQSICFLVIGVTICCNKLKKHIKITFCFKNIILYVAKFMI